MDKTNKHEEPVKANRIMGGSILLCKLCNTAFFIVGLDEGGLVRAMICRNCGHVYDYDAGRVVD